MKVFVDSNIPMYVAGKEHPHREPSRRLLDRVRSGEIEGCTSTEVLQEILYRYSALRRPDLARSVYELFVELCPVVHSVTLADTDRAKELLCGGADASARDALHAAVMLNNGIHLVATFDTGFDHFQGVERLPI